MRSGLLKKNAVQDGWPLRLRRGRLTPAVEYVQTMRTRGILVQVRARWWVGAWVGGRVAAGFAQLRVSLLAPGS